MAHQNTGKLMKRVAGKTPIEGALQKLEDLTREEALVVAAKNLGIADRIYGKTGINKLPRWFSNAPIVIRKDSIFPQAITHVRPFETGSLLPIAP
jgi:hypothetical protein